jgi:hypothetical protein
VCVHKRDYADGMEWEYTVAKNVATRMKKKYSDDISAAQRRLSR